MTFQITHNYCHECKKFRKLFDGICVGCLGYEPTGTKKSKEEITIPLKKKPLIDNQQKKIISDKVSTTQKERLDEEQLLKDYLNKKEIRYKQYWKKEIAEEIGWTISKVSIVARRLQRKNQFIKKHPEKLISELLEENPQGMTPREIQDKLCFSSMFSLYGILHSMVQKGQIKRKKHYKNRHIVYSVL